MRIACVWICGNTINLHTHTKSQFENSIFHFSKTNGISSFKVASVKSSMKYAHTHTHKSGRQKAREGFACLYVCVCASHFTESRGPTVALNVSYFFIIKSACDIPFGCVCLYSILCVYRPPTAFIIRGEWIEMSSILIFRLLLILLMCWTQK